MNLKQIKYEVKMIVADSRFDSSLVQYINESYFEGVLEARLPEYIKVGQASTVVGSNFISVLDEVEDFSEVIKLLPSSGKTVTLLSGIEELSSAFDLGLIGTEVEAVAFAGTNLWYAPIPTTVKQFQFFYFGNPEPLETDRDEISLFPELIQRKICIHGACVQCFNVIEDGVEGPKLNTEYHKKEYEEGVLKLKEWNGRRRPHRSSSVWSV